MGCPKKSRRCGEVVVSGGSTVLVFAFALFSSKVMADVMVASNNFTIQYNTMFFILRG